MYRMALKYYENNAVGVDDVFKLPVPTAAISTHLSKYETIESEYVYAAMYVQGVPRIYCVLTA